MHCPICYERSKGDGARPLRRSIGRVAAEHLNHISESTMRNLTCPESGHIAAVLARHAAHAARHLEMEAPARYARLLPVYSQGSGSLISQL